MHLAFIFWNPSHYFSANYQALQTGLLWPRLLREARTPSRYLSAIVCAAFLVMGCGGSSDYPLEDAPDNAYTQTPNTQYASSATASSASSFTVNPTENFNGFNPEDWNSQQSWVECNCGNNKAIEPRIMSWNPDA